MPEMIVSAAIFTALILGLYGIMQTGTAAYFKDSTLLDLQQQARNGMDRMVREIRQSKGSAISYYESTGMITFTTPQITTDIQIYCVNGNLVRINPPGAAPKILATNITNLSFSKSGSQLILNITAGKTVYNQMVSFPLQEEIRLRNE